MNTLTSSISKMMQRPQPPAARTAKPADTTLDTAQPVIDSDRASTDAEIAAMQPSMRYASRVPPQNQQGSAQVGAGDAPTAGGPTILRRPILQRGSSGPTAPEAPPGAAAGGPVRPGARSMGPGVGAVPNQGQAPPGMAGLAGVDGGDGMGGALPKAKVRSNSKSHSIMYTRFSIIYFNSPSSPRSHSSSTFTTTTHRTSSPNSPNSSRMQKCHTSWTTSTSFRWTRARTPNGPRRVSLRGGITCRCRSSFWNIVIWRSG